MPKTQQEYEKVLVLSDLHKGCSISKYKGDFQRAIEEEIAKANHIVLNGDVFELFDILNVIDSSKAQFGLKNKANETMQKASDDAIKYLEMLLEKYPEKKFHFVLGNHENLRYFTKRLDELEAKHIKKKDNFNWSPEAIRLGEALFTHGDLQMEGQVHGDNESDDPRARGQFRLRHLDETERAIKAAGKEKNGDFSKSLQTITERWQFPRAITSAALSIPGLSDLLVQAGLWVAHQLGYRTSRERAVELMHNYLHNPEFTKDFHYLEGCGHEPKPFTLEGIKHVFFGHTHLPFTAISYNGKNFDTNDEDALIYHNTGSLIKGQKIKKIKDMQAQSFDLMPSGKVENSRRTFSEERAVGMSA